MTNEEILSVGLDGLRSCSHASAEDIERVEKSTKAVLWAEHDDGGWGPEHSMSALVELTDGSYAVIYEAEDSTGHGCQCSGDLTFFHSLEEALNLGLTLEDRAQYSKAASLRMGNDATNVV